MSVFRRLAAFWCLTAMLVGQVAQAKVLITYPGANKSSAPEPVEVQNPRNLRIVESIIRATKGESRSVYALRTKTEWMRTGTQVWAGTFTEQFDGVIHVGAMGNLNLNATGFARPESLWTSVGQGGSDRADRAVPFLLVADNTAMIVGSPSPFAAVFADSTIGVNDIDAGAGKGIFMPGDQRAWLSHAYIAGGINTGTPPSSAFRKILSTRVPAYEYRASSSSDGAALSCKQCDSLAAYTQSDTLVLWDRQFNQLFGQANTATVVAAYGAGSCADSAAGSGVGRAYNPATEGDFTVVLAGLAHMDSLVRADTNAAGVRRGGKVLGDKVIKIAPVIYGAMARGERHSWKSPGSAQGISKTDTSAFYAILDSIKAYNIPVTFAVNVDSAASYERDIIKLKSVSSARFTPQVWNGIADSTKAGGQDAKYRPVDVFGRFRNRTAVGDGTGVGGDSSVYTLAKSARRICDSLFTGRTSRIAVAPDDDWSPLNTDGVLVGSARVPIDSVLYALKLAGFDGVVLDAQDPDANATKRNGGPSKTNPRGYYGRQGYFNSGSISALRNFKLLAHSGYPIMGGRAQVLTYADSLLDPIYNNGWAGLFYKETARVWSAALLDFDDSFDTWGGTDEGCGSLLDGVIRSYDNIQQRKVDRTQAAERIPVVRGNIMRMACADLSGGDYGGVGGAPAAPMWHVMKSILNAMYMVNKLAGRTVVTFAYPEDIEP